MNSALQHHTASVPHREHLNIKVTHMRSVHGTGSPVVFSAFKSASICLNSFGSMRHVQRSESSSVNIPSASNGRAGMLEAHR